MKINKSLFIIFPIALILELIINAITSTLNYEVNLILDIVFAYFIINCDFFLEEESYSKEKYILNINNLIILITIYIEAMFSTFSIFINIFFIFLFVFLIVNKIFPKKLGVKQISVVIVYFTIFFIVKNYISTLYYSDSEFYFTIFLLYVTVVNIFINTLITVLITLLFPKILKAKKREANNKISIYK